MRLLHISSQAVLGPDGRLVVMGVVEAVVETCNCRILYETAVGMMRAVLIMVIFSAENSL